ncbi:MAG: hypothetical protein WD020_01410 [Acidimicrobiia bacterium]
MTFELFPALVAGLVATLVMSAMMTMSASAGMTRMPPMTLVTGAMMSGDPDRARRIGAMIHYVVLGTIVFGIAYGALFTAFGSSSVLTGILIGAVHGVVVGAIGMPMMPAMHPRMTADSDGPAVDTSDGTVVLSAPGFFGARWGAMTPMGLIVGHVVYGLIAALVYGALV